MEKKCIKWIKTNTEKPGLATDDIWFANNGISSRVLVSSYNRRNGEIQPPRFARYHIEPDYWNIESVTGGDYAVTHFAYLNEPLNF